MDSNRDIFVCLEPMFLSTQANGACGELLQPAIAFMFSVFNLNLLLL